MHKTSVFLSGILLVLLAAGCTQPESTPPNEPVQTSVNESTTSIADCPLTIPQVPAFTPPAPYDSLASFKGHFWFGSNSLWTVLPESGVWAGLPFNPDGYTQKILWWRDGYVWDEEPEPNLTVTGERLDASAPPLVASKATNAYASDIGSAMLVGVDFPTLGCWKITGKYNDVELSFAVWVAP